MATTATATIVFLILISVSASLPSGSNAAFPPSLEPAAPPMESGGGGGGGAFAPGPAEDPCLTALFNMSDCLTYVEQGSQLETPDKNCCPELSGLVDGQPICLCKLLGNTYSSFGIQIDVQKALKLPTVCGLDAPPASACALLGFPVNLPGSPSGAPAPTPAMGGPDGSGMDVPIGAPTSFLSGSNDNKILSTFSGISLLSLLYFIFFV